ncbi:hypothetical protein Nepgr_008554 [Nepenthes gracilis]|uniref:Glycosyltransferase n=1 Tax=Nepenthes gracilis TaxID=150966 RepID=A0AAD3S9H8_NEPGR|nr:hypothetical protein Nepgr_008554 [Nepenthes gracilis]
MEATRELIFIPLPAMGHLNPAVEMAKRTVEREGRISITMLIIAFPFDKISSYIQTLAADASIDKRIKFLVLPELENLINNSETFYFQLVDAYKPVVKKIVQDRVIGPESTRSNSASICGFVVDMICAGMMDVAKELNVPSYVFFTSGVALLGLMLHLQTLRDDHGVDVTEFNDPDTELDIPGFRNPVPLKVLPSGFADKSACTLIFNLARSYRKARGILVNTFMELESDAIRSLSEDAGIPPIYPVGPIINLNLQNDGGAGVSPDERDSISRWLDSQPPSSVVFLCFGSKGSIEVDQVREVADGLERSGHRFLWSLRWLPANGEKLTPREYDDFEGVLPNGFSDRTASVGRVIGWAPQVSVLSHPAVGSFVSHCGWNSLLESLWFGVPMAAWPMYAEQQLNAFKLVVEWGLAAGIRIDYVWDAWKKSSNVVVKAEEIERGIRRVMDGGENEVRNKVKQMREMIRKSAVEGGSSYAWLGDFVEDIFENSMK